MRLIVLLSTGRSFAESWWWYSASFDATRCNGRFWAADFNGDGRADLACGLDLGSSRFQLVTFTSTGGSFTDSIWYDSGAGKFYAPACSGRLAIGDFNGDGKADLICGYDYGGATARLITFLSTGTSFLEGWSWYSGQGAFDLGRCGQRFWAADVNGDGRGDIVCGADLGSSRLQLVTFTSTGGSFAKGIWYDSGGGNFYAPACGSRFVAGDLNGDGRRDLLCAYDYGSSTTRLIAFLSSGGAFGQAWWWYSGPGGFDSTGCALFTGDSTGDGRADATCANTYSDGSVGMEVFANQDGALGAPAAWCAQSAGSDACVPRTSSCAPTTCAAQGAQCGTVPDGCGGALTCGNCTAPLTCGGGGTPNACGQSTPTTQPPGSVSVMTYGAKGDGVTDDSIAFQNAAATGQPLWIPSPRAYYLVTKTIPIKNSVYGQNRPEIRFSGANGDPLNGGENNNQDIFLIKNYRGPGLVIDSVHLNGNWPGTVDANGKWRGIPTGPYDQDPPQWSHCIRITESSQNITIRNSWLEKPVGDCVAITWYGWDGNAGDPAPLPPDNIRIENSMLTNPWRNAVTVTGGTNVTVTGCYIEDLLDGSAYGYPGNFVSLVDLETDPPYGAYQYVSNVSITNNVFNASRCWGNAGAVQLSNASGNANSGNVTITGNHGTWSDSYAPYNGQGLVGVSGSWTAGTGVTAANNVKDGTTTWSFQ